MTYAISAFLETKSAMAAGFSPDGSQLLVASNPTGTFQLYRAPITGGTLQPITSFDEPVNGRYLPGHEGTLLIQMDEGGNERHQVYLIEEDGSGFRQVVYEPEYIFRVGGVTHDGRRISYASNRRNGVDFDIYVHDLETGERLMVFAPGGWCDASRFSPDGRYLAVIRLTERNGDNDLYVYHAEGGRTLGPGAATREANCRSARLGRRCHPRGGRSGVAGAWPRSHRRNRQCLTSRALR